MPSTEKIYGAQPHLPPASGNLAAENEHEHEHEHEQPKKRINGGLDAWLNVLAGFCVFVKSWSVYIVVILCLYYIKLIFFLGAC